MAENVIEQARPKIVKLSRRQFLSVAGGTLVSLPLVAKALEQTFYQAIISTIGTTDINDTAVLAALSVSEKAPNSENPHYRPMVDVIREGITNYREKSGLQAFFSRTGDYQGKEHYAGAVGRYASSGVLPRSPNKLTTDIAASLPASAFETYFQSQYAITGYDQVFTNGTGFDARFRKRHPELVHKSGLYINSDTVTEEMCRDAKTEIEEIKNKVEERTKTTKVPISSSFILVLFLEKNNGDLAQSLFDTAIFLKFMARNDIDTGDYIPGETNTQWYRENIVDEYQGPTYNSPPQGEEAINLIGKPYHSWNLVALLSFIPVEVIRLGGIQKQLDTLKDQGVGKTRSDLQTLDDLREIEGLLLSYSPRE